MKLDNWLSSFNSHSFVWHDDRWQMYHVCQCLKGEAYVQWWLVIPGMVSKVCHHPITRQLKTNYSIYIMKVDIQKTSVQWTIQNVQFIIGLTINLVWRYLIMIRELYLFICTDISSCGFSRYVEGADHREVNPPIGSTNMAVKCHIEERSV